MTTKVYGTSDDLIVFEGDLSGEVESYDSEGTLVSFSDGTVIRVKYGKADIDEGIWDILVLHKGTMFDYREEGISEDDDPYSDVIYFKSGSLKAWAGSPIQKVR